MMADERRKRLLAQIFGYRVALQRYLRRFTAGAEDVDDLVQEAYMRVFAMPDGQPPASPRALLFRVARNLVDLHRRFEAFCAAVDSLPPLCRRVFVLRKVYQLSHEEIAEVMGLSRSTIEKHVAKGLIRCRDRLRSLGVLEGLEVELDGQVPGRRVRDGESR